MNHTCLCLPSWPRRDRRLSWPWVAGWLHTEINAWHRELNTDMLAHLSINQTSCRLTARGLKIYYSGNSFPSFPHSTLFLILSVFLLWYGTTCAYKRCTLQLQKITLPEPQYTASMASDAGILNVEQMLSALQDYCTSPTNVLMTIFADTVWSEAFLA